MIESKSTSFSAIAVTCYWHWLRWAKGARKNLAWVGEEDWRVALAMALCVDCLSLLRPVVLAAL